MRALLILALSVIPMAADAQWRIVDVVGDGSPGGSELNTISKLARGFRIDAPVSIAAAHDGSIYFSESKGIGVYEPASAHATLYAYDRFHYCSLTNFTSGVSRLDAARGVAESVDAMDLDASENLYIASSLHECTTGGVKTKSAIIKINKSDGRAWLFAGGQYNVVDMTPGLLQPAGGWNNITGLSIHPLGRFWIADRLTGSGRANGHIGRIYSGFGSGTWYYDVHTDRYRDYGDHPTADGAYADYTYTHHPEDVHVDRSSGRAYWVEADGRVRRQASSSAKIYTVADISGWAGGTAPRAIAVDDTEDQVFVATRHQTVLRIDVASGSVQLLAGWYNVKGASATPYGLASDARFRDIYDLVWAGGVLYVTDRGNDRIRGIYNPSSGTNVCGDGLVSSPETCDDGNRVTGDGCSTHCFIEYIE